MTRYFENFEIDDSADSPRRTITEADLVIFAGLSGDHNPHHTDELFAQESGYGKRIAHGALIFSISTGLSVRMSPPNPAVVAFYGVDRLRFTRPVFIGDTIQVHNRVAEKEERSEKRGVITFENTVKNQHGNAVLVYLAKTLFLRRPADR
jgi:3-hydroxybutyryl-CoA dehydratase